jgi:hypothetical protein
MLVWADGERGRGREREGESSSACSLSPHTQHTRTAVLSGHAWLGRYLLPPPPIPARSAPTQCARRARPSGPHRRRARLFLASSDGDAAGRLDGRTLRRRGDGTAARARRRLSPSPSSFSSFLLYPLTARTHPNPNPRSLPSAPDRPNTRGARSPHARRPHKKEEEARSNVGGRRGAAVSRGRRPSRRRAGRRPWAPRPRDHHHRVFGRGQNDAAQLHPGQQGRAVDQRDRERVWGGQHRQRAR